MLGFIHSINTLEQKYILGKTVKWAFLVDFLLEAETFSWTLGRMDNLLRLCETHLTGTNLKKYDV